MTRKLLSGFLCLILVLCASFAAAESRYTQVFDTSADAGRLIARFIAMITETGEKSGDATVITSPDGEIMLIDAGDPGAAGQVVAALKAMNVTRIDYLVASHPHIDHVGGFPEILRSFEVGKVLTSRLEYPSSYYSAYMDEIKKSGVVHEYLQEGDTFLFGSLVTAEVFWPGSEIVYYDGYPDSSTQFVNNLSLVLKLTYNGSSMLFGGDLYTSAERELAARYGSRLQSDVFKVGHHGDATSSTKPYREAIAPRIAVMISDTLEDLNTYRKYRKAGVEVYITYFDGSVRVSTPGSGTYEVLTEKDRATDFLN